MQNEVPKQLRFADQRRLLSRVALSIALILAVYLGVISIVMPLLTVGKVIAAIAAILIASLSWLCRFEKLYTASAATIVATTIIGGFVASLSNGGADGFVAPIMILAPVIAAVFIGARATLCTAAIVILAIVSLWFLEQAGFVRAAPYSDASLEIAAIVMLSAATGICAAGVGYFAHAMQTQIASLRSFQDRLMDASKQLQHAAHHDSLTGAANRQGLKAQLNDLLAGLCRNSHNICFIHVDLDEFKSINDTFGHPVGDEVLKNSARIMGAEFDQNALVGRVGGDEFVIIQLIPKDTPASEVSEQCDRLVMLLSAPMDANGVECRIGASIGFVVSGLSECTLDSLWIDADLALYEAKRAGKRNARLFVPAMREKMERDHQFKTIVESALDEDRVRCVLQPQVDLRTGEIRGVEGLGRIRCSEGELLLPAQVLPVVTEIGRLSEFDIKVMQCSLDALVSLRATGLSIPYVSVNASAHSLRRPDYVALVCAELSARALTTSDIVNEILESTLIESANDNAVTSINRLREAGIRAIMDDFGSGHATISNLLKLELDGLKIDRSLVASIESDKALEAVKAIHGLASGLSLTVIAEGVETVHQHNVLREIGLEAIQGFGICKPMGPSDLADWLREYGTSPAREIRERIALSV